MTLGDDMMKAGRVEKRLQRETHADLIDRIKAGSGYDRDLACDILEHLGICPHREVEYYRVQGDSGYECTKCKKDAKWGDTPDLTRSLDACIGLMREVLPGWNNWGMGREDDTYHVSLWPPGAKLPRINARSSDLCRALLIAILQAVGEKG